MFRMFALVCAFACVVALHPAAAQQVAPSSPIVIENTTVINVDSGARWSDQTVVVTGNRISAVGQAASITRPAGARVVDGRGKFLIPGIWDSHVHALFNEFDKAAPYLAAIGVTSFRDMANSFEELSDARKPRTDPNFIAPRMAVATGPALDGVPPNFPIAPPPGIIEVITSPEQGRDVVNRLAAARVDHIKVRNGLTTETYMAIAAEAKRWGLAFDGHLPPDVNAIQASDAGQRVIEHMNGFTALCAADPNALRQGQGRGQGPGPAQPAAAPAPIAMNRARCEEVARHMVRNGTWVDPTVGGPVPNPNPVRQFTLQVLNVLFQAGVPMLAGTDWPGIMFGNGQRSVHQELAGLVEAGLTPQQALKTATVNPARLFKLEHQLGSVEQGKLADLLLLDGDPLVDITNTTKIAAVVVNGKLIDAARRQKMLADFDVILKEAAATRQKLTPPAPAPAR
jgi:imidazolonepropionase-like amidohydrolase